jgi:CRP/FNR family cyclic AMP-dependent transcriptional regulator
MPAKDSPSLIKRFSGPAGKRRLVAALRDQFLVAGNNVVARALLRCVSLHELRARQELIKQGNSDNDLYFILSGTVSIRVNHREIATRTAGEHVGEISMIDTTALRSATVCACEKTVVARVSESEFSRIAEQHPDLWRKTAVALGKRLRERNKFQPVPRSEPAIFIGSSSEGLPIGKIINRYLQRHPFVPRLWSNGVFEATKTTIEDLMRIRKETDFAVLVLTGDDVTKSRGKGSPSPRDNVIFELGLFMGALDRERTYIVAARGLKLKIPTDLLGVKCLPFHRRRGRSLARNLQPVLQELRKLIQ